MLTARLIKMQSSQTLCLIQYLYDQDIRAAEYKRVQSANTMTVLLCIILSPVHQYLPHASLNNTLVLTNISGYHTICFMTANKLCHH